MIDIKTLISDINLKMDEEFIIQLDGIITTKIKTNGLKLQEEKKCIKFFDKNNNEILCKRTIKTRIETSSHVLIIRNFA